MKLTPLDIHHKEFRNALRGYNPEEVDDFLDEVADEFERLFKENIDLSDKLDIAAVRVKEYGALEQTLQNTLVSAQTSAEEIKARAKADADRMIREAEAKAAEVVSSALQEKQHAQAEVGRLQSAEKEFRSSFRTMLDGYMAKLSGTAPAAVIIEDVPVAAADPEPVVAEPEPDPEPELFVEEPAKDADEVETPGSVVSLTLGETAASSEAILEDDDMPSLEIPEEFALPPRGPVGELDDLDIEEID
ncbi:MAG TPA: DivIVA domain-containing protein [Coriobacteriia bacterium]